MCLIKHMISQKMINLFSKTYDVAKMINLLLKTYDFTRNDKLANRNA